MFKFSGHLASKIVIDFCQFRYWLQRTFYAIINPRRLAIIIFNVFIWNIIWKNI